MHKSGRCKAHKVEDFLRARADQRERRSAADRVTEI
jgi:hypothetical protein